MRQGGVRQLGPDCHYGVSIAVDGSVRDRNVALGCGDSGFSHRVIRSVMLQWLFSLLAFRYILLPFVFLPSIHRSFHLFFFFVHISAPVCLFVPSLSYVFLPPFSLLVRSFIHLISVSATATFTGDELRLLSAR